MVFVHVCILFQLLIEHLTQNVMALNNINLLFYSSGGQKSKLNLAAFLLAALGENLSLSSLASSGRLHSLAHGPFFYQEHKHLLSTLTSFLPLIRTFVTTLGPPGIQEKLPISKSLTKSHLQSPFDHVRLYSPRFQRYGNRHV